MEQAIDPGLLTLIRCPVTRSELSVADPDLVDSLNRKISDRQLVNRIGQTVEQAIDAALVNQDRSLVLPIRGEIVVLVADQSIPIE